MSIIPSRALDVRTEEEQRDDVDRVAREWVGTPYHEGALVKGRNGGTDCAMLLRGVYHESGLIPAIKIERYSPQFFLHKSDEIYMGIVQQFAHEIPEERVRHGDVALYWIAKCYAHGAIVVRPGWPHIVHAHFASRCVLEGSGTAVHLGMPVKGIKFFSWW